MLIGTYFIFSGVEKTQAQVSTMKAAGTYATYLHSEILRVVPTYVGLSLVIFGLAFVLSRTSFPATQSTLEDAGPGSGQQRSLFAIIMRYPRLRLAVAAQFFYVGAQVGTWSNFIPYIKAYTAATEREAGWFLTGTLIALAVGRVVSTSLMRLLAPERMLALYAGVNVMLMVIGITSPGMGGTWAILLSSFFMSIMFPTIFALGLKGLGEDTKLGGSLIVMAILGGALFPLLMGAIKDRVGSLALAYVVPLMAYVVVGLYGLSAQKKSGAQRVQH